MKNNKNYQTLDEIELNKNNELIDLLKEKLPNVFHDGILSLEALKQELNLNEEDQDLNEKYGLYWKGKFDALNKTKTKSLKTLISDKEKSLNFDQAENIIIEGDNLEVLKLLQNSYFKQVDIIYIDPPYNTGNDFIYNDDFKENSLEWKIKNDLIDEDGNRTTTNQKSDGRFHSNWLNMIYPRLILARKLLKEDGIIFISIDDNEQSRLKMICDEIFGEQNFVANLIWHARRGGGNDVKNVAIDHEYIISYAKDKNLCKLVGKEKTFNDFKYEDEYVNDRGRYNLQQFDRASLTYTVSLDYPVEAPDGTFIYPGHVTKEQWKLRKDDKKSRNDWRWMMSEETYKKAKNNGFIVFEKSKNNKWNVKVKTYQFATYKDETKSIERLTKLRSILNDEFGITRNGNIDIDNLKLRDFFSYPKPVSLLKNIIKYIKDNKNSLILDFFAGSGTTAQAVMELNKEDGGKRKYILVQLPEKIENSDEFKTICDITRERAKRSIKMFEYPDKGFKYFKLVDSNFKINNMSNHDSIEEIQKNLFDLGNKIKEGRTTEDLIYEIILRIGGLPLTTKLINKQIDNYNVYWVDDINYLFILETNNKNHYDSNLIRIIKNYDNQSKFNVYLNDVYFDSDENKLNLIEQIKLINNEIKIIII